MVIPGADPGFQVRGGGALKKLRRAEGGAKFFWIFRVKNHDFTPKNLIFSNFRGGGPAPWIRPCIVYNVVLMKNDTIVSVIICYDFYHND
jgi:hypothetical protein